MKVAIITVAGISSRFNEGIPEEKRELKAIYTESGPEDTLLCHLIKKCIFADKIIIVGGYRFESLKAYCDALDSMLKDKLVLVYNDRYMDLGSGYSFYLGLEEALGYSPEEILFVEGDLDVDKESLNDVINAKNSVLTYNYEPIYANKAVVLYRNAEGQFKYAFNSNHGELLIEEPFSCILNSGQVWKFTDAVSLKNANKKFYEEAVDGTNLVIIQNYLNAGVKIDLMPIKRWTNCNTRDDFKKIASYWEEEE